MTNPHTEELRRRMGAMSPWVALRTRLVAGGKDDHMAFTTALNITAFLASDGAEEEMARVIDPSTWREIGHEAVRALIELLAEKGCG